LLAPLLEEGSFIELHAVSAEAHTIIMIHLDIAFLLDKNSAKQQQVK
jgi:hypothetical protein